MNPTKYVHNLFENYFFIQIIIMMMKYLAYFMHITKAGSLRSLGIKIQKLLAITMQKLLWVTMQRLLEIWKS